MTFDMEYIGTDYNGNYRVGFTDMIDTHISLTVNAGSFSKAFEDMFKDFPNDFRDMVHRCMADYALAYFENNPIPEDDRERFFELLEEITDYDYEESE